MILKFDKPIELEKARELYNDNVKFITSTGLDSKVEGIEFDTIANIEKRKIIAPKVSQKREKIVEAYKTKIDRIWNRVFNKLKADLREEAIEKEVSISAKKRRLIAKGRFKELRRLMTEEAKKKFTEAYKLGKLRGQILTNQEIDDDLTAQDEKEVDKRVEGNIGYLIAFSNDLQKDVDTILLEPFETYDEIDDAITQKVQEAKRSRMHMYALAALGLVAVGMAVAMKKAEPEFRIEGGYWTIHPSEGLGGPVCQGCSQNSGQWMTVTKFLREYQDQDCITNCRCDLDTQR